MKIRHLIIVLLFLSVLAIASFKVSYALFASNASNSGNSFTAASSFPTPPPPPPAGPQAGDVVINEINWGGSGKSTADEWVELRNMTGSAIDLSNWVVVNLGDSATPDIVIPSGKSIAANGFFLISNFPETSGSSNLNITPDFFTSSVGLLNNSNSELLILKSASPSGTTIDSANQAGGNWFAGTSTDPQKSMERNSVPGNGTAAGSWHSATTSVNLDLTATESATPRVTND